MDYFCIGEKLSHSLSPGIHEKIGGYGYGLLELSERELPSFFEKRDFKGINVTIPYKKTVIPYMDRLTELARKIGAVNTVVNKNGILIGDNTDYAGLKALLLGVIPRVEGKKALILGTGGTSKTAATLLNDLGAEPVLRVSRNEGKGDLTYRELDRHRDAQIIINTTPVGMYPHQMEQPVDLTFFEHPEAVIDAVYNPLKTKLIVQAEELRIPAAGGLDMLVWQAIFAARDFGFDVPDAKAERIIEDILFEKHNLVLIGMPGAGKTTVGQLAAVKCGKTFVDTDEMIEKSENMPISGIFAEKSEAYFRAAEKRAAAVLSQRTGLVIATGGGLVLDPENVKMLRQNGVFVFLDRSPDEIGAISGRPLVKDRLSLERLWSERRPIYEKIADLTIKGAETPEESVEIIFKTLLQ